MQSLNHRRILVVGASSGIGRAVARTVANLGADVVVVGRRRQLLDTIIEELGAGAVKQREKAQLVVTT
ncbi:MAG: SDR family NAD(P)-dependent oxidoreductase [Acidimicrobiales bacterium]